MAKDLKPRSTNLGIPELMTAVMEDDSPICAPYEGVSWGLAINELGKELIHNAEEGERRKVEDFLLALLEEPDENCRGKKIIALCYLTRDDARLGPQGAGKLLAFKTDPSNQKIMEEVAELTSAD